MKRRIGFDKESCRHPLHSAESWAATDAPLLSPTATDLERASAWVANEHPPRFSLASRTANERESETRGWALSQATPLTFVSIGNPLMSIPPIIGSVVLLGSAVGLLSQLAPDDTGQNDRPSAMAGPFVGMQLSISTGLLTGVSIWRMFEEVIASPHLFPLSASDHDSMKSSTAIRQASWLSFHIQCPAYSMTTR